MGELLLCNGPIAAMPFYLEGVSINIYSIEELDYYIINNVYLLDKSFMNQELCAWIENQANLKKLAEHLKMIISTNGRLSAFVTEILEYSGYCSATQISSVHDILRELEGKSSFECAKLRADSLMEAGKYQNSIIEYRKLLSSEEAKTADTALCGNVYNNMACAYARLFLFETAAVFFRKAYQYNKNRKSLWSCLISYKCMGDDDKFNAVVEDYQVDESELIKLEDVIKGFYSGSESSLIDAKAAEIKNMSAREKADIILKYKEEYRSHVI